MLATSWSRVQLEGTGVGTGKTAGAPEYRVAHKDKPFSLFTPLKHVNQFA